ncbi:amino acid/polyamine transporter I [Russula earlei]|uniref:Amino acid/polyamine transporter I n=1 Tax=Russula earlei TaxID=71964 RepID=A0ACC0U618_9AGAM|nr:amino acid/polyamine transporter I [Russula earlei]
MGQDAEVGAIHKKDEAKLATMGYKQELRRNLGLLQNFGVSFSIVSVVTGVSSLFLFGLTAGGPAVMVWGWLIISFFTLLVGFSMAGRHICSAYPTSGGTYFWAAKLSSLQSAPFASWITGWFNLLGQVSITTGVAFACADFISTAATIGANYQPSSYKTIAIYAGIIITQGIINTFGVRFLKYLNNISVWWQIFGTLFLVTAVLATAPRPQSSEFVFGTFIDGTGVDGVGWSQRASPVYVAVIGLLMAQYTMTGFDASVHMTEETRNAAMTGPIGIVMSFAVSAVLGWFLILRLLFSIQDYQKTVSSPTGQPVAQIFLDTVGERGAIVLLVIVFGTMMFWCGTFAVTSNSRMIYAFCRDGAIPGSKFFHKVDSRFPVRTVWLSCALSFMLGLPSLGSQVAFNAATSITTIGLYISYGVPIALRVINADGFVRGPFHLGKLSYPVAITVVVWIGFISIVFCLPQVNPINAQTFNYAPVAVGVVLAYALVFWAVSARKWFTGPVNHVEGERTTCIHRLCEC